MHRRISVIAQCLFRTRWQCCDLSPTPRNTTSPVATNRHTLSTPLLLSEIMNNIISSISRLLMTHELSSPSKQSFFLFFLLLATAIIMSSLTLQRLDYLLHTQFCLPCVYHSKKIDNLHGLPWKVGPHARLTIFGRKGVKDFVGRRIAVASRFPAQKARCHATRVVSETSGTTWQSAQSSLSSLRSH
jgi:hypothetical protein